jgi:hypothetical protein
MFDLYEEFKSIVSALERADIDYAVCGGLAMAVWGAPRATVDIDLLILAEAQEEAKSVARGLGFTIEALPITVGGGVIEIRRFSKIDSETGIVLPLDFILVAPEINEIWDSRVKVPWESTSLWSVSRRGLIALKSLKPRPQDLVDIERLKEAGDEG